MSGQTGKQKTQRCAVIKNSTMCCQFASSRGKNTGKPMMRTKRVARGCGSELVLWDVGVDQETGKVREVFCCNHCSQEWKKTQIPRISTLPVVSNFDFVGLRR